MSDLTISLSLEKPTPTHPLVEADMEKVTKQSLSTLYETPYILSEELYRLEEQGGPVNRQHDQGPV